MGTSGTKGKLRQPMHVALAVLATLLPTTAAMQVTAGAAGALRNGAFNMWLLAYALAMLCAYLLLARLLYLCRYRHTAEQPDKKYLVGFGAMLLGGLCAAVALSALFGLISLGLSAAFGKLLSYGGLVLLINLATGGISIAAVPLFLHIFFSFGLTGQSLQEAIKTALPPRNKHYGFTVLLLLLAYGLGQAVFYISTLLPNSILRTVFSVAAITAIGTVAFVLVGGRYEAGRK